MKAFKLAVVMLVAAATWAAAAQQTIRQTDSIRQMVSKLNGNFTENYSAISTTAGIVAGLVEDVAALVPYTGATANVDLGAYGLVTPLLTGNRNIALRGAASGSFGGIVTIAGGNGHTGGGVNIFGGLGSSGGSVVVQPGSFTGTTTLNDNDGTPVVYVDDAGGTHYMSNVFVYLDGDAGIALPTEELEARLHASGNRVVLTTSGSDELFGVDTSDRSVVLGDVAAVSEGNYMSISDGFYLNGGGRLVLSGYADMGGNGVSNAAGVYGSASGDLVVAAASRTPPSTGRDLVLMAGSPVGTVVVDGYRIDVRNNVITNVGVIAASNGVGLVLTGESVRVAAPLAVSQPVDMGGQALTNSAGMAYDTTVSSGTRVELNSSTVAISGDLYIDGSGDELLFTDRGDGARALYLGFGLHMQPGDADIDAGSNDVLAVNTLVLTNRSVISGDKTSTTLGVVSTNTVYLTGVDVDYDGRYEYVPADGIYTFKGGGGDEIHLDDLGVDGVVWQLYYEGMTPTPSGIWCPVEDFPAGPWWNSDTEEEVGTAYFGTNGFTVADDAASTRRLRLNLLTLTNDGAHTVELALDDDTFTLGSQSSVLELDIYTGAARIGDIHGLSDRPYIGIDTDVSVYTGDLNLQDNNIVNVGNIGTPEDPVNEIYVSDGSIYLGAVRMSVSNGGISVTSTNDPTGGSMTTGSNGLHAAGTATWFEDLTLSGFEFVDPAGPGGVAKVQITNYLYGAEFSPNDWGNGILQLKHQYKAQSTVYPHLHTASTNLVRATTNTWFIGLTSGRIGVQFTNHYSATITVTNQPGVWHNMPQFPGWTTNMAESTVIGVVVSNMGPDTAILVDADIHIEGEKLGTDNLLPDNP